MKIRVGKDDCIFYVNKNKRTVTCLIQQVNDRPVSDAAYTFLRHFAFKGVDIYPTFRKQFLEKNYVGVAKCSPEDHWDEEIGKKLAFARAKIAFYRDFLNVYKTYINLLTAATEQAINTYDIIFDKVYENVDKIVKQIGD